MKIIIHSYFQILLTSTTDHSIILSTGLYSKNKRLLSNRLESTLCFSFCVNILRCRRFTIITYVIRDNIY